MVRILLIIAFLSFSGFIYAGEDEAQEPVLEYLEMSPKFTVNLAERKKYLLVNVQLMVEGAEAVEKIKKHFPVLRHQLIMFFSGRFAAELQTSTQREKLRQGALETIREALDKYDNSDGLRDLFFTEFLVS